MDGGAALRPYARAPEGCRPHDGTAHRLRKSTLSLTEAGIVTAICFGLFILFSFQAVAAGFPEARFTDEGFASLVGLELVLGAGALAYLRRRQFDIQALYPAPTPRGSLIGLAVFGLCWVAAQVAVALFHTPGQADMVEVSFEDVSASSAVLLAVVNGSYEEVFLLGVLVRGLRGFGLSVAIGVPLLVRVLYHLYQGPLGVVAVGTMGLVMTLSYVATGKLWPAVLAHILLDIAPML